MTAVMPVDGKANGFHDLNGKEDVEAPSMRRVVSTGALETMGMRITFQVHSSRLVTHPPPFAHLSTVVAAAER